MERVLIKWLQMIEFFPSRLLFLFSLVYLSVAIRGRGPSSAIRSALGSNALQGFSVCWCLRNRPTGKQTRRRGDGKSGGVSNKIEANVSWKGVDPVSHRPWSIFHKGLSPVTSKTSVPLRSWVLIASAMFSWFPTFLIPSSHPFFSNNRHSFLLLTWSLFIGYSPAPCSRQVDVRIVKEGLELMATHQTYRCTSGELFIPYGSEAIEKTTVALVGWNPSTNLESNPLDCLLPRFVLPPGNSITALP